MRVAELVEHVRVSGTDFGDHSVAGGNLPLNIFEDYSWCLNFIDAHDLEAELIVSNRLYHVLVKTLEWFGKGHDDEYSRACRFDKRFLEGNFGIVPREQPHPLPVERLT